MVTELAVKTPLNRLRARSSEAMLGDFKSFLPAKCRSKISKAGLHWGSKQRYLDHTSTNFWSVWKASKLYMWIAGKNDHDWSEMIVNDQKWSKGNPLQTNSCPSLSCQHKCLATSRTRGLWFWFHPMSSRPSQMELSIWAIPRCHRCIVDHIPQFTSIHIKSFQVTSIHLGFIWFYIYLYIVCANQQPHHSPELKTRMMTVQ